MTSGRLHSWDTSAVPDLDAMWLWADAALLRCLELAHQAFLAGGVSVGSVIVADDGEQVSEGRNRAYDPAGGADRLQRTPIAHAEINALATVATGTELGDVRLLSSHRLAPGEQTKIRFTFTATTPAPDGAIARIRAVSQSRLPQS